MTFVIKIHKQFLKISCEKSTLQVINYKVLIYVSQVKVGKNLSVRISVRISKQYLPEVLNNQKIRNYLKCLSHKNT